MPSACCSIDHINVFVFQIKNFKSHILQPNESAVLFELTLNSDAVSSDLKLKTFLNIHTNISNVEVPLLSYNGKLTLVCILSI